VSAREPYAADDARKPGAAEEARGTAATDDTRAEQSKPDRECLKLTSYFGERDRSKGHLVADALLDLYGERGIQNSILLRGAEGFGLEHHLRSDRLLTLSEDLPVVAEAVDVQERIDEVLPQVLEIQRRGLVTLERARFLTGAQADTGHAGTAAKLTVYLGRHERIAGRAAFAAVCQLLHSEGIAGASAFLGVDGTRHGERRRARFFATNTQVPMTIVAVGAQQQIAGLQPQLAAMLNDPLLTLERVRVCKHDGRLIELPHELPGTDGHGLELWQKLTIVNSEAARHAGRAVHLELIRRLRQAGAAGATAVRGIWGFHGAHAPHGDKLLSLRRHVPILTAVIDTSERIAQLFPIVDEMTREQGLVTSEIVPAMSAYAGGQQRGGLRLAQPRPSER
jgi:PII-like signaling protein